MLHRMLQGCPAAHEVVLCASELATNALLHSDTREAGGTFPGRAEITSGESVTIEVEDDGGCWAEPRLHPVHGHGLDIVGALTDDWGIREIGKRRVVWARLHWSAGLSAQKRGRYAPPGGRLHAAAAVCWTTGRVAAVPVAALPCDKLGDLHLRWSQAVSLVLGSQRCWRHAGGGAGLRY
jgi:hypothetical protein